LDDNSITQIILTAAYSNRAAKTKKRHNPESHPARPEAWWLGLDLNQRPPGYQPNEEKALFVEPRAGEIGYGTEMCQISGV